MLDYENQSMDSYIWATFFLLYYLGKEKITFSLKYWMMKTNEQLYLGHLFPAMRSRGHGKGRTLHCLDVLPTPKLVRLSLWLVRDERRIVVVTPTLDVERLPGLVVDRGRLESPLGARVARPRLRLQLVAVCCARG